MATPCDYCLFGEHRSADSLRDALRDFWRELYRRDPDGVRGRTHPSPNGIWRFPVCVAPDRLVEPKYVRLDGDLWAFLGSPNRQDLERTCWDVLEKMDRSRSDFVIYELPDAPMFPNDARYDAVTREFKRMQAAHVHSLEDEHRPIDAFLRIREAYRRFADEGVGSTKHQVEPHAEVEQ